MVPAVLDPIPGCIYDSFTFPQGNRTLLTVMMGGAWYDQLIGDKSEVEVERMAVENVSRILNISSDPVKCPGVSLSTRWATCRGWHGRGHWSSLTASTLTWSGAATMAPVSMTQSCQLNDLWYSSLLVFYYLYLHYKCQCSHPQLQKIKQKKTGIVVMMLWIIIIRYNVDVDDDDFLKYWVERRNRTAT